MLEKCMKSPRLRGEFVTAFKHFSVHQYVERSKGYKFYCPSYNTRIMESRNAKFLENDLISGSDQSKA